MVLAAGMAVQVVKPMPAECSPGGFKVHWQASASNDPY